MPCIFIFIMIKIALHLLCAHIYFRSNGFNKIKPFYWYHRMCAEIVTFILFLYWFSVVSSIELWPSFYLYFRRNMCKFNAVVTFVIYRILFFRSRFAFFLCVYVVKPHTHNITHSTAHRFSLIKINKNDKSTIALLQTHRNWNRCSFLWNPLSTFIFYVLS